MRRVLVVLADPLVELRVCSHLVGVTKTQGRRQRYAPGLVPNFYQWSSPLLELDVVHLERDERAVLGSTLKGVALKGDGFVARGDISDLEMDADGVRLTACPLRFLVNDKVPIVEK